MAAKKKAVTRPPTAQEKLAAFGEAALFEAITSGKTLTAIAKDIGVAPSSLVVWVEGDSERSARAREARTQSATLWDEKATQLIEQAKNPFQLAKAKEMAHHLRWRASKIAPKQYGEKVQVGGAADLPPVQQVHVLSEEALIAIAGMGVKGK